MSAQTRIAVIGSYAVALVMDVERLPQKGETLLARNFRHTYGGKGSDMAVQAARLGAQVEFIGVVGSDGFAEEFKTLMWAEGVSTKGLRQTAERLTGAGFIIKSRDGHNIITVDMAANELFSAEDVDRAVAEIQTCQVMLIQLEIPLETALYAARIGKKLGLTTILNPAPAQNLCSYNLNAIDFLTPNETEARGCLGLPPDEEISETELAARLSLLGCRNVVTTLGERGADLFNSEGAIHVDAVELKALDTNGAGDAFNAALAVALGEKKGTVEALRFANAVAGLSCTLRETVPSYHRRDEVEAFLSNRSWKRYGYAS